MARPSSFERKELLKIVQDEYQVVSNYSPEEAKDPSVFLTWREADTVRIYLKPDLSSCLSDEIDAYYNGQRHDLRDSYIKNKLPKVAEDLLPTTVQVASDIDYEITQVYYLGSSNTQIDAADVVDAGIYRLELRVTLVLTDKNSKEHKYEYIVPDDYEGVTRPGIILTVYRRKITITSNDVFKYFYANNENKTDTRITAAGFEISDLATYDEVHWEYKTPGSKQI